MNQQEVLMNKELILEYGKKVREMEQSLGAEDDRSDYTYGV